jgi:hypothetical protein
MITFMIRSRTYHWTIGLFIGLFLLVQASTIVHATQYGDGPHEHDGVMCVAGAVSCEEQVILPTPAVEPILLAVIVLPHEFKFVSVAYLTPQGRAPPPRSPPLTIQ